MKIKAIFLLAGLACSLYAVDCGNSYDRNGCDELTYDLGSKMAVSQYQVIYDGDQDGVRDSMDDCLDTPLQTKVDEKGCHTVIIEPVIEPVVEEKVVKTKIVKIVTLKVNFRTAKYDILKGYQSEIEEFANFLIKNPEYKAKIVGHTDSRSAHTDNILLSLNRAKSVRDKLVDLGVAYESLSVDGVGPNEPIASNDTREGRAKNRRIEVTVTKEEN